MNVLKTLISQYMVHFTFTTSMTVASVEIPQTSVGAIARAAHPCMVAFQAHD